MKNKNFLAKIFSPTPQIEKSRKFCPGTQVSAHYYFFVFKDTLMKLAVFFIHYMGIRMKCLPELILTSGCAGAPLKMYQNSAKNGRFFANNENVYAT